MRMHILCARIFYAHAYSMRCIFYAHHDLNKKIARRNENKFRRGFLYVRMHIQCAMRTAQCAQRNAHSAMRTAQNAMRIFCKEKTPGQDSRGRLSPLFAIKISTKRDNNNKNKNKAMVMKVMILLPAHASQACMMAQRPRQKRANHRRNTAFIKTK